LWFSGLRLLGIGRNEYIDLMNQCRSGRKLFRRKNVKDLLPPKPAGVNVEPWWNVEVGCVIEEDIKVCMLYYDHFLSFHAYFSSNISLLF